VFDVINAGQKVAEIGLATLEQSDRSLRGVTVVRVTFEKPCISPSGMTEFLQNFTKLTEPHKTATTLLKDPTQLTILDLPLASFCSNFALGFFVKAAEHLIIQHGMSRESAVRFINIAMAVVAVIATSLSSESIIPLLGLTLALALASGNSMRNIVGSALMAYTLFQAVIDPVGRGLPVMGNCLGALTANKFSKHFA